MIQMLLETLEHLSSIEDLTTEQAQEILKQMLKNPVYTIFIATPNNKETVVGTTTLFIEQKLVHHGGRVGHIEDVVVNPDFEKQGIGSALVKQVVKEAQKQKCYKVILNCSSALMPFYEKLGFKKRDEGMRLDLK